MNENFWVNKSNYLVNAVCRLGELEQKIISVMISEIQPIDKDFKDYKFEITEFMDLLGIKDKGTYEDIKEIVKGLMTKVLCPENATKTEIFHWISYYKHEKGSGQITIRIAPELKPYLLELKKFTAYQLKNILPMNSKYAIRIYEIIKSNQYKRKKIFTIDVDRIKEILDIQEEYSKYNDFKRKVILTAQKEINTKSDILFEFEEIKRGKKVNSIKFIIHSKQQINEINETAMTSTNEDTDAEAIKKIIEIMDNLITYSDAKSIYLKSNKDIDKIRKAYDICKNKDIDNLTGYMIKLVSVDIADPVPQKKKSNRNRTNANFDRRGPDHFTPEYFKNLEKNLLNHDDEN